jgi:hypothetical protein
MFSSNILLQMDQQLILMFCFSSSLYLILLIVVNSFDLGFLYLLNLLICWLPELRARPTIFLTFMSDSPRSCGLVGIDLDIAVNRPISSTQRQTAKLRSICLSHIVRESVVFLVITKPHI